MNRVTTVPVASLRRSRAGSSGLTQLPPLALYIHLPWCLRKCPYCDFNSHEAGSELAEQAYLSALRADLEQSLPLIWGLDDPEKAQAWYLPD